MLKIDYDDAFFDFKIGFTYNGVLFSGILEQKDHAIFYIKDGLFHREDGPAKDYGYVHKEWLQNNLLHRLDGPALIHNGTFPLKQWFYMGDQIDCNSQNEFERIIKLLVFK